MSRQFIKLKIPDLEALVDTYLVTNDRDILQQISEELKHRSVNKRNTALLNKLMEHFKNIAASIASPCSDLLPKNSKSKDQSPIQRALATRNMLRKRKTNLEKENIVNTKLNSSSNTPLNNGIPTMKSTSKIIYPEGFLVNAFEDMRNKLLDISGGRSRLLNLDQNGRGFIRIVDELPDELANSLLKEKAMTVVPVPEPTRDLLIKHGYLECVEDDQQLNLEGSEGDQQLIRLKKDPDAKEWAKILGLANEFELPKDSTHANDDRHTDADLQTLQFESALTVNLKKLSSEARTAIEETGNNILYLLLGFLEWFDQESGGRKRLAPLYMIPVSITKERLKGITVYTLQYNGEDIIPNLTLREKLQRDFEITLPGLTKKDDEESLLTPEEYFAEVESLIKLKMNNKNVDQWKVRRFGTLATLSLGKLLMYRDLDPARWPEGEANLLEHDVIKRFFQDETRKSSSGESGGGSGGVSYVLDDVADIHQDFPMVDDADSSQMSVLIDVLKGQSLVVEGPPGTGKSQTITNLIAAALSQNKTVLFVAEKQAALDVVKRRMDKAGLGDFCLDLHSDKAQKRIVLDGFNQRIKNQNSYSYSVADFDVQVERYERARKQLQEYALMVNKQWKDTGLTIQEVLSAATRYANDVDPVKYKDIAPEKVSGSTFTRVQFDEKLEQLELFYDYLERVSKQLPDTGNWSSHPWHGVENKKLHGVDEDNVIVNLQSWNSAFLDLESVLNVLCEELEISDKERNTLEKVDMLIESWSQIPELKGNEFIPAIGNITTDDLTLLESSIEKYKEISQEYKNARDTFTPEVVENLDNIKIIEKGIKSIEELGVHSSNSFDDISRAIQKLEETVHLLDLIEEKTLGILPHLPADASCLIPHTSAGFKELLDFINLSVSIPAKYLSYREDIFDNEELLGFLPSFYQLVERLLATRKQLEVVFDSESLPSVEKLKMYSEELATTNVVSWLRPSWRNAKNAVLTFTKQTKLDYKSIAEKLKLAAHWSHECNELKHNKQYKELLGNQFEGIDTDTDRVNSIHVWYQHVRSNYGIGFGQKVVLARTLFSLPTDVMRGLHKLKEDGFVEQLTLLANSLDNLGHTFTAPPCFNEDNVDLFGDVYPLKEVLSEIRESMKACQGYLINASLSQSDLRIALSGLIALGDHILKVECNDISEIYFNGELDLTVSKKGNLPKDLSRVIATIDYQITLNKNSHSSVILGLIKQSIDGDFIEKLINSGNKVKAFNDLCLEEEFKFFEQIGGGRAQWFENTSTVICDVYARNNLAIENGTWLDNWVKYLFAKERMESGGYSALRNFLSHNKFDLEHVKKLMKFATYQCLAREIYQQQPELSQRSGHEQSSLQQQFSVYDEKLKELQRKRIASIAAKRYVPNGTSGARVASYSEGFLLNHEIGKRARHISIRNLVTRAGEAMQAYKPCFMMGPMATAKYIPPGSITFDLVIMDEASQVKPQDALSCFARGKQVVVVGDPKQLPPTSFFEKSVSNDNEIVNEDEGIIGESESILDAISSQFPMRRLRWHYRSRHESLIEFSNTKFYDSNLVVFPSPWSDSKEFGIKFNYIEAGRFINNINQAESRAIVSAIRTHLIDCPLESLGVVAMNSKQRDLIDMDIESLVGSDAVFRKAYEDNLKSQDPLFIKNLENVQGDERDVIFISFTYGPKEKGSNQVPQRFGPINGASGWRRLNVLFTRSKKRIQVYSSMTSNQIVVNETSSRGLVSLKEYLEYAQHGRLIGQAGVSGGGNLEKCEPDSDFEIAVIDALGREGFECVPQVGVAGFYIDLAVRDPGMPGRYLLGVECDGATYHSSKSTRDRDKVRQSVLEGLDWKIRRIWSTDWFKNPLAELKPIIDELHRLKTPISEVDSQANELQSEIKEIVKHLEVDTDAYMASATKSLKACLVDFSVNVIAEDLPNTPEGKKLLRADMIERLVSERPITRDDFLLDIPHYLRKYICADEAKYLDDVLEIISEYESLAVEKS